MNEALKLPNEAKERDAFERWFTTSGFTKFRETAWAAWLARAALAEQAQKAKREEIDNATTERQMEARHTIGGDGFDSATGGFQWIVINGFAIDPSYVVQALRAQVAAEDRVDPEGLFRGLDSIRARAALAEQAAERTQAATDVLAERQRQVPLAKPCGDGCKGCVFCWCESNEQPERAAAPKEGK